MLPFLHTQILANTIGGKLVVTIVANFLCVCAAQHVYNVAHTETLIGACHTREEFLRVNRVVFLLGFLLEAVITIAAIGLYISFTEIGQQDAAATDVALTIRDHLLQLLQRHKLLLLTGLLSNKKFNLETVAIAEKDDALRG